MEFFSSGNDGAAARERIDDELGWCGEFFDKIFCFTLGLLSLVPFYCFVPAV